MTKEPIIVTGRELDSLADEALDALIRWNDPPGIFVRGNELVRIAQDATTGHLLVVPLTRDGLRDRLARCAEWQKVTKTDTQPCFPPYDVVNNIRDRAEYHDALPVLDRIVQVPVFAPDGTIDATPGYQRKPRVYYDEPHGFGVVREVVAGDVTPAWVSRARALLDDQLTGFPFAAPADRAHAIALELEPFARAVIDGPTPLYLFDAPVPGTGKSTLVRNLLAPSVPDVPMHSQPRDPQEWQKQITALLRIAPAAVVFDNVNGKLGSDALERVLTARVWSDRILGHTKVGIYPVRNVWAATVNNASLSTAIARRSVRCRLDARMERPWERAFTRDIDSWTRANRALLVCASIVLIRWWVKRGQRPGTQTLASYESWSKVMGGILETAGIEGFLENRHELWEDADVDDDVTEWTEFLALWSARIGEQAVTADEVARRTLTDPDMGEAIPTDLRTRLDELGPKLGYALRERRDRVYGRFQIHRKGRRWVVRATDGERGS